MDDSDIVTGVGEFPGNEVPGVKQRTFASGDRLVVWMYQWPGWYPIVDENNPANTWVFRACLSTIFFRS